MAIKKERKEGVLARSQVMSLAERAVEDGAIKAILICRDAENNNWFEITENFSIEEAGFALRQTEFRFMLSTTAPDDGDEDDEES